MSSGKRLDGPTVCELVVCKMCNGSQVEPKLLPCLHSYCKPCLEKHYHNRHVGERITCPQCATDLDNLAGLTDYRTNLLAAKLQEDYSKMFKKSVQTCGMCEKQGKSKKAAFWCSLCREFFCEACNKLHTKMEYEGIRHKVTPMEVFKKRLSLRYSRKKDKEYCEIHTKETVKVYCVDCQVVLCLTCKVTTHDEHHCISIQDASMQYRSEITTLLIPIATKMAETEDTLASWLAYQSEVEAKEKETNEAIEVYKDELLKMVEKWYSQSLQTLKRSCDREFKVIEGQLNEAKSLQTALETARLFGNVLVDHGKDAMVATLKKDVINQLENLQNKEIDKPQEKMTFSFQRLPDIVSAQSLGSLHVNLDQESSGSDSVSLPRPATSTTSVDMPLFSFVGRTLTDQSDAWLTGVTATHDGEILVADHRNNALKWFSDSGQVKRTLYFADSTKGGCFPKKAIWDCSELGDGNIVVASVDGLYTLSTNREEFTAIDNKNEYTSVSVNSQDNIIAFNDTEGKVVVFDYHSGSKILSFAVYTRKVLGWTSSLCADADGQIYVLDVSKDCIRVYSESGKLVRSIGEHGKGPGEFIRPRGITTDNAGNILIADKGNHRIQKFSPEGTCLGEVLKKSQGLEGPSGVAVNAEGRCLVVTEKGLVHMVKM